MNENSTSKQRGTHMYKQYLENVTVDVPVRTVRYRKRIRIGRQDDDHREVDQRKHRGHVTPDELSETLQDDNLHAQLPSGSYLDASPSEDEERQGDDRDTSMYGDENDPDSTQGQTLERHKDRNMSDGNEDPTCRPTQDQILALIIAFSLRHCFSSEALQDFLKLVNIFAPGSVPVSIYLLDKLYDNSGEYVLHFYCSMCKSYLGRENDVQSLGNCELCGHAINLKDALQNGDYFYVIPLKPYLEYILKTHRHIHEKTVVHKNENNLTDIRDGELYRDYCNRIEHSSAISLLWNSDGVPIFKSSSCQIWAVQCQVIELPPTERAKQILISSLWCGRSKPNMQTFLQPFVLECQELEHGFNWTDSSGILHMTRVHVLICSSDSVARPLLKNTKQFNGYYGCDFCYHVGGDHYAYKHPEPALRSKSSHLEYALDATDDEPIFGIKGPCQLLKIKAFDIINGFVPEYQHSVCLGVTRQFVTLWCDSKYHNEPWYIGNQISVIDKSLTKIQPPSEITRTPRSLTERKFWKASEFRSFLLFYSLPILHGVLPQLYWKHFSLLVYSIYVLLTDHVSEVDLFQAELSLKKFVISTQELYGESNMSYNMHLLTHLTSSVRHWGPLWATSTFSFESNNGTMIKYFNGTQHAAHQIVTKYLLWKSLPIKESKEIAHANEDIQQLFRHLNENKKMSSNSVEIEPNVQVFGRPEFAERISITDEVAIENCLQTNLKGMCGWYYQRFIINSMLIHSKGNNSLSRRKNSILQLADGRYCEVQSLLVCKTECMHANRLTCICSKKAFLMVRILTVVRSIFNDQEINTNLHFIKQVNCERVVQAICATSVANKCVLVEVNNKDFAIALPNKIEKD